MPFEDYLILKGEDIIEVEYCMSELVDMALGQRKEPPSFDLNEEPSNSLDVDERPPPIMRSTYAHQTQLLATFFDEQPIRVCSRYVMKPQAIS